MLVLQVSGDLTASGSFRPGDVSFIPSPRCHLSAHGCTLLITAAPRSQDYTAEPVVVSESGASNKPVFFLSVIRQGESAPVKTKLPEIISTPLMLSDEIGTQPINTTLPSPKPAMIFTAGQLSASIIPHTISNSFYTANSNGPVYQMIQVTNIGGTVTLNTPVISGTDTSSFSIDTSSADYAGSPIFCNDASNSRH